MTTCLQRPIHVLSNPKGGHRFDLIFKRPGDTRVKCVVGQCFLSSNSKFEHSSTCSPLKNKPTFYTSKNRPNYFRSFYCRTFNCRTFNCRTFYRLFVSFFRRKLKKKFSNLTWRQFQITIQFGEKDEYYSFLFALKLKDNEQTR